MSVETALSEAAVLAELRNVAYVDADGLAIYAL